MEFYQNYILYLLKKVLSIYYRIFTPKLITVPQHAILIQRFLFSKRKVYKFNTANLAILVTSRY